MTDLGNFLLAAPRGLHVAVTLPNPAQFLHFVSILVLYLHGTARCFPTGLLPKVVIKLDLGECETASPCLYLEAVN